MFETFYATHRPRPLVTMRAWAYCMSWKQKHADQVDAELMRVYTNLRRAAVTTRARHAILAGIAGGRA